MKEILKAENFLATSYSFQLKMRLIKDSCRSISVQDLPYSIQELLEQLSSDVLKRIFENIFAELCPYYLNDEIISKSTYDRYRDTNIIMLKTICYHC